MEEKEQAAPGRESELLDVGDARLMRNYRQARMVLDHGEGCTLYDTEGRSYLDFMAGIAVCALGHAHPSLAKAIAEQAGRLMHVSNYFFNEPNVRLAEELCAVTGFDRVFFCSTGTEANEALIKLARRHFFEQGKPRVRLIAFEKAFHGRTMGSLTLTGNPTYLKGFGEPLAGVEHVPYGDLEVLRERMADDVAAVFVEPVQGEGGVNVPPEGFLKGVRELCDEVGALMMVDEIQTGVGRTGKFLAIEHSGVAPDGVSIAKALGGGFPIGAMLVREKLLGAFPPGAHGTTFGGNPLASTAARTVLRVLREDDLLAAAEERGQQLSRRLREVASRHPKICTGAERGLGLLRAIQLKPGVSARDLLPTLRDHGLLAAAAGDDALRFIPPLVVTAEEIDQAMGMLDSALGSVEG